MNMSEVEQRPVSGLVSLANVECALREQARGGQRSPNSLMTVSSFLPFVMSKDVRRLFAAQKAAKAGSSGSGSGPGSGSSSLSSSKRVTHPLAKYDPKTLRLTCAICGPTVPIKSDNLWNAHLVSKAHQEAVAKLRAVKEQMQKREAETAERVRLQQEQQQQQQKTSTQAQGVKRKAPGGLVAYAEESESESDDDNGGDNQMSHDQKALSNKQQPMSESKRVKLEDEMMDQDEEERQRRQAVADIEEEEHDMAGLPAGFFDSGVVPSNDQEDGTREAPSSTEESTAAMDGVLPAGFFDDPEMEARVRAEVGGATTDQLERQVEEELKALQAELAQDLEDEVENRGQTTAGPQASAQGTRSTTNGVQATSNPNSEYIPYEEKVEQEEQELEESMLERMEEEYQLFVEMQTRVDSLREKKNRLIAPHSSSDSSSSVVVPPTPTLPDAKSQPGKQKKKSILELVREQERAKKEKERLAAEEYNRVRATVENDSKMAGSDDESEEEDDEEDIEAMMDWRARRF